MEAVEFETLVEKVEQALSLIEGLKSEKEGLQSERDALQSELHQAQENLGKMGTLETAVAAKDEELESLRRDLGVRSENMAQAGNRVRDLVTRLEAALV